MEKGKKKKTVSFETEEKLKKVHNLFVWEFAYRKARVGSWRSELTDRIRFQDRIKKVEPLISIILNSKHREKIKNAFF